MASVARFVMFDISDEKYEELRLILEKQNGRAYTLEEAKETCDELVDFYRLLLWLDASDGKDWSLVVAIRCYNHAMVTRKELRELTYKKIKTIKRLIKEEEWEVAGYLMGYVLECALKAASCKALRLEGYPPVKFRSGSEGTGFKTHEFEQLLIVSGLNDFYGKVAATPEYSNWSDFTAIYPGVWTSMRYEDMSKKFNETLVKELARNLYDDNESIIETIKKNRRW